MPEIHVLEKHVAELIAAGGGGERPGPGARYQLDLYARDR